MNIADPGRPPGRILVVEDDAEAAFYAVYVLTTMGHFEVAHTPDPAVALRRASSEPWDLVLTDLDMPGMSGLELLGALRQAVPALPVAVITAHVAIGGTADELRQERGRVPGETGAPGPARRGRGRADRRGGAAVSLTRTGAASAARGRQFADGPRRVRRALALGCSRQVFAPDAAAVLACSHFSCANWLGGVSRLFSHCRVADTTCDPGHGQAHGRDGDADADQ